MTAYKQAYGEHYTHEVVPFAEIVLVRVSKPTHRGLQGGKTLAQGRCCVHQLCVWVGRSETSEEHIVLTPGGRVLSRTIRRTEPSRRHDAVFLSDVKGLPLPWDAEDGIHRVSNKKGIWTTATHSGWREYSEAQSGPARPNCGQSL